MLESTVIRQGAQGNTQDTHSCTLMSLIAVLAACVTRRPQRLSGEVGATHAGCRMHDAGGRMHYAGVKRLDA